LVEEDPRCPSGVLTICIHLLFVYYRLVYIAHTEKKHQKTNDYLVITGYFQQSTEGAKYKFSVTSLKLSCENILSLKP
jgi:hypothetical protein